MSIINKLPEIVNHEYDDCSRCREAFLYATPFIAYSIMLSGIYIFALKAGRKIRAGRLPLHSDPLKGTELSLVVGEVHHPREQMPSETPRCLVIPEWGLFTGITIVGAVGSRKTASCMYAFAEQILAYRAEDPDRRIGGLILEVKGDFCGEAQEILTGHGRHGEKKKQPRIQVPLQEIEISLREQL